MHIYKITITLFSIVSCTSLLQSAGTINHSAKLPLEVLTKILVPIYVTYDDPKDFTRLKLVSKQWHAMINSESFKIDAKAQGFIEPMLVFHRMYDEKNNTAGIINTPLTAGSFKLVSEKIKAYHKDGVQFEPVELKTLSVDSPFSGIFTQVNTDTYPVDGDKKYIALWVNPTKTDVFNSKFYYDQIDDDSYFNSRMKLSQYMQQCEKGNQLITENTNSALGLFKDPITAEPSLKNTPSDFARSYDYPFIFIKGPVLPSRFVKQWPSSYQFEIYAPKKKSVSGTSYDMGCAVQ